MVLVLVAGTGQNPHDRCGGSLKCSIADADANCQRALMFLQNRESAMERRMFCAYINRAVPKRGRCEPPKRASRFPMAEFDFSIDEGRMTVPAFGA